MAQLTHASFFSGAGGMDIGLERAGWQTVSFSEIEPYPCAILAEKWPDIPNLGDIMQVTDVPAATLWTGGFPCQDLSVAGKRGGIHASRSGLAWSFLALVERHRPEAFLLENVPGLLSSNAGRDFGRLLREVGDLGYGWAYRLLDAQWFGVPQRRRRVFILALDLDRHPDADSAGAVLAIGSSCRRDHPKERQAWAQAAGRTGRGADIARQAISSKWSKQASGPAGDEHHHLVYGPPPDSAGMRAPDGMAGRVDDCDFMATGPDGQEIAATLRGFGHGWQGQHNSTHAVYVKGKRAMNSDDYESWRDDAVSPTLNGFDVGDARATTLVAPTVNSNKTGGWRFDADQAESLVIAGSESDDAMNPNGLDSNRYRAIGNGVASPVAEWIGARLAHYLDGRGSGV